MIPHAPYATDPLRSRGRLVPEPESPSRTAFQRDRDRIIHSTAFRRLKHKTQVFVYHEGDHFRTRLTHSLEVAQIARSMARALGLDEDLTEALALAHDLGHTPFGHAGERELNELMARHGGFNHNAQGVRIVTRLERRYAAFDGLNLTWETLEGLIKHGGPLVDGEGITIGPEAMLAFARKQGVDPGAQASAEAQIAAISDDIAYNAHDIDDGLRAKLFDIIELGDVPLAGEALSEVLKTWPDLARNRVIHETGRRVISWMVEDVLAETRRRLDRHKPRGADDVRSAGEPIVAFSAQMREKNRVLQGFLSRHVYHHAKIDTIMQRARRVVRELFLSYLDDPSLLPADWSEEAAAEEAGGFSRQVCDFIAGMTDRYALQSHKGLFDLDPLFR